MDIIQLLPEHVANQIAAGEVIQRPSSAVKEMLENALDAGGNDIKLFIKDAGKTLIHVVDNGCGMSRTDLKMCFERHATSKIRNADDLFEIQTMGFRGEAMSSIAAISHVEVRTKLTEEEVGSLILIKGGEIITHEDSVTTDGTSVKIKNLFFNVPARRNFLKSDLVEMRHITEEFSRISLSNPQIKMQLFHNNKQIFHLDSTNFRQRIVNIIGGRKNELLVPIQEDTSIVKIDGYIGKPESAKKTRGEQYFFVNKRFIKNHFLNHAVNKAFEDLIPKNYFPSYFININLNPRLIDINIHPTKTEIKFENEQDIYAIMRACIKRSLGKYNIVPSIDFLHDESLYAPSSLISNNYNEPKIRIDNSYNPFNKNLDAKIKKEIIKEKEFQTSSNQIICNEENIKDLIQIGNKYILFANSKSLILLNQRRAHKRILYEYFCELLNKNKAPSQQLLFPKKIDLNNNDIKIIEILESDLQALGFLFKIEANIISIISIPPECQEVNLQLVIESLIQKYKNNEGLKTAQNDALAISLAYSLAIKANKKLNYKEMYSLKNKLLKCNKSSICPKGKKTMINILITDLEKYF